MKIIALLTFILVVTSCGSSKIASDIKSIRFGSGGGFTGEIKQYELSPAGKLSSISNQDTTVIRVISKSNTKEILESAEDVKSLELNKPENMYRFIEIDYNQSSTNRLVWGVGFNAVPQQIDTLFNKLISLTN